MGNVVLWKPASTAMLSAYYVMRLFQEAGLPDGVINLLPGSGATIGGVALEHRDLAGIHFTGSTATFQHLWQQVSGRLPSYRTYPRLVGETGGKDFVLAHPSADAASVTVALIRGAFEYQGQKCSAASRAYIPKSLWPAVKALLQEQLPELGVGDVAHLMFEIVDSAGTVVPTAGNTLHVAATGAHRVTLDNGDLRANGPRVSGEIAAFNGRGLAYVQAKEAGWVEVTASAEGLRPATIRLRVEGGPSPSIVPGIP
jgi:delta 1-pyrroline-5-carboxylate dehydrogenase